MTPGERIKKRRRELKLSQIQAAKAAGISQSSLSEIETGETRSLKGRTLFGIARALKTTTAWIMNGRGTHDVEQLTEPEELLLTLYGDLTGPNKSALLATASALLRSQGTLEPAPESPPEPKAH
jgi:transcriptional regulator with XRE-family HTH domain